MTLKDKPCSNQNSKTSTVVTLTYKHFQDVDLVDERSVVFDFLFLDSLNGKLLMALPVFCKVDDAESSIGKLLLEGVDFLDVALCGVHEVLRLRVARVHACRTRA